MKKCKRHELKMTQDKNGLKGGNDVKVKTA